MASPVNRRRRVTAFERGFNRPQGLNPYRNAVLVKLWDSGKTKRLAKTGGLMPTLQSPSEMRKPTVVRTRPGRGQRALV
jgi:hypothetical protein